MEKVEEDYAGHEESELWDPLKRNKRKEKEEDGLQGIFVELLGKVQGRTSIQAYLGESLKSRFKG
ncbi:hypothetical protein Ccrd_013236 [Cynara cardunculus var. scolymus]|uniref:Uncharacterized protein n=1 Tax=Cynara cardunculus var. scolymus TaxID=59895 RepID=A0A103YG01_CYNCS|nr:hypothetical protein Ccrd_013236 [Cynara cardunculus var. scolymus]